MLTCVGTLAPPGTYDWTVHLRWRCGLMSNYFDHLLNIAKKIENLRCILAVKPAKQWHYFSLDSLWVEAGQQVIWTHVKLTIGLQVITDIIRTFCLHTDSLRLYTIFTLDCLRKTALFLLRASTKMKSFMSVHLASLLQNPQELLGKWMTHLCYKHLEMFAFISAV